MTTINDNTILIRGLDVTARLAKTVAELSDRAAGGILLETVTGRYVLDSDARLAWLLMDGRRSVGQLLDGVAEASGLPLEQIRQPTYRFCERLLELGLVDVATPADVSALTSR
ncbi:PqqD family protein [Microbispora sp. RL4-1S]|uniref:PqqD family protein n=1 Tax=Microbispora oryzae TaxID=2806554 RepID=A0A940WLP9_9ACTN|nr:PqqD family protein [Microbispora oryzae]MBP2707791.1 PqqD family protein [Microbispora oryzae]